MRQAGTVTEVRCFDQWDARLLPLIERFETPAAICGYAAMAVAELLDERWADRDYVSEDDIERLLVELNNMEVMMPRLAAVMSWLQSERKAYVLSHASEFVDAASVTKYMRDWVANYEISDWLGRRAATGARPIGFIRHIERDPDSCAHEEARRLPEEAPFAELLLFIELWDGATRSHLRPSQVPVSARCQRAYVADLLGHFVAYRPVRLLCSDGSDRIDDVLLLINSMASNYCTRPAVAPCFAWLFDQADETTTSELRHS